MQPIQNAIVVGCITFENVPNFKFLGEGENSHEEFNRGITAEISAISH